MNSIIWLPSLVTAAPSGKPCVAASIVPLADLSQALLGNSVTVKLILPPGQSEHRYDPTPREIQRLAACELFLVIGLGLDPWADRIAATAGRPATVEAVGPFANPLPIRKTLPAAFALAEQFGGTQKSKLTDGAAPVDPHVWLDPLRWVRVADRVAELLGKQFPNHKTAIDGRLLLIKNEINSVDAALTKAAQNWRGKKVVTVHGAFGYFASRYALAVPAVIELIPGDVASPRYVAAVLSTIKKEAVDLVIAETQLDKRSALMLQAESGVPLVELDPIGRFGGDHPSNPSSSELLPSWNKVMGNILTRLQTSFANPSVGQKGKH